MFTGLVEEIGSIVKIDEAKDKNNKLYKKFRIGCKKIRKGLKHGDSINVNGACQTVISYTNRFKKHHWIEIESLHMTLEKTNFSNFQIGDKVNLERALQVNDRMGGHIVTGHIQTTASIDTIEHKDENTYLLVALDKDVLPYLVEEGSIAIDGISLTIAKVMEHDDCILIMINLISHTVQNTNMQYVKANDKVNIEFDMLLKYAHKSIQRYLNATNKSNVP